MRPPTVLWIDVGSTRHGVHRFGRLLADATTDEGAAQLALADPSSADSCERVAAAVRAHRAAAVVLQFTDRLWADDPTLAADHLAAIAAAAAPARTVVGLHDLPTADDPEPRRRAYATVAAHADHLIVCSEHERARLRAVTSRAATVIPHPVEGVRPRSAPRPAGGGEAAVLGFVYPGKGHDDLLAAAAVSARRPTVVAVGGAAPGHDDLLDRLGHRARRAGVRFQATGWLSDDSMASWAQHVAVPVVPNSAPSASGSLASWLAAGRRPLVRDGAYAREVAALAPGCVELYPAGDPVELAARLDRALAAPERTVGAEVPAWLAPEPIARRWVHVARSAA